LWFENAGVEHKAFEIELPQLLFDEQRYDREELIADPPNQPQKKEL
jgi:hypothetical protein